jgi:hypothetical protein
MKTRSKMAMSGATVMVAVTSVVGILSGAGCQAGCQEGSGPPNTPVVDTGSPADTAMPPTPTSTATGTSAATLTPTATATATMTATATATTTATSTTSIPAPHTGVGATTDAGSGKCTSNADCPSGYHCAQGMPLNGRCWKDGTREPICLAADTKIATTSGDVAVRDLTPSMRVWTLNARGERVAAALITMSHVPAPVGHVMTHVVFADGRELSASPGHPTCAGAVSSKPTATMAELREGQRYDRAAITKAEQVPYTEKETYDLLPAGDTGCYWANGVLLGSTLR